MKEKTSLFDYFQYFLCRLKRIGLPHGLRYYQLYDIVKDIQPKTILEIGVFDGENAVRMLNFVHSDVEYYGFDLFENLDAEKFKEEIAIQPLSMAEIKKKLEERTHAKVSLYKENTNDLDPAFFSLFPKMDLIFIDGGHSTQTQRHDWLLMKNLMHKKTVVVVDDYWNIPNSGSNILVQEIDPEEFSVEILPAKDFYPKKGGGLLVTQCLRITRRA